MLNDYVTRIMFTDISPKRISGFRMIYTRKRIKKTLIGLETIMCQLLENLEFSKELCPPVTLSNCNRILRIRHANFRLMHTYSNGSERS